MNRTAKLKRNIKIYALFLNHEATKQEIAERYNLTWRHVHRIIELMRGKGDQS